MLDRVGGARCLLKMNPCERKSEEEGLGSGRNQTATNLDKALANPAEELEQIFLISMSCFGLKCPVLFREQMLGAPGMM